MIRCNFKTGYILALMLMAFAVSCKTARQGEETLKVSTGDERRVLERALDNAPQYSTMSAKCTFSFGNISSKAQMRMINGKFLQISFQPLLGIEMVRIMLTGDSLYVIDRINNLAAVESLSAYRDKIPGGAGITELQKLLLGVPFLLSGELKDGDYDKFNWQKSGDKWVMTTKRSSWGSVGFRLDAAGRVESTTLYDAKSVIVASCDYSGYMEAKNGVSPSTVKITLSPLLFSVPASMEIKNISPEWDKKFTPNFDIPQRYERVTLTDLINRYLK